MEETQLLAALEKLAGAGVISAFLPSIITYWEDTRTKSLKTLRFASGSLTEVESCIRIRYGVIGDGEVFHINGGFAVFVNIAPFLVYADSAHTVAEIGGSLIVERDFKVEPFINIAPEAAVRYGVETVRKLCLLGGYIADIAAVIVKRERACACAPHNGIVRAGASLILLYIDGAVGDLDIFRICLARGIGYVNCVLPAVVDIIEIGVKWVGELLAVKTDESFELVVGIRVINGEIARVELDIFDAFKLGEGVF